MGNIIVGAAIMFFGIFFGAVIASVNKSHDKEN